MLFEVASPSSLTYYAVCVITIMDSFDEAVARRFVDLWKVELLATGCFDVNILFLVLFTVSFLSDFVAAAVVVEQAVA